MGVRGLTTFVKNNQHMLMSNHRLHDTRVIIDANNLAHFLLTRIYNIPQAFGGDYDRYAAACRDFFSVLKQCHIVPYVVFDGGYSIDDEKLDTLRKRGQNKRDSVSKSANTGDYDITIRPILARETFKQVLVELQIAHVSCHFEADKDIAVLAKKWGCPVMSDDSDFLVYHLEGGVIPLHYLDMELRMFDEQTKEAHLYNKSLPLTEHQVLYIPVQLYQSERFTKNFRTRVRSYVLPVFATLLGNDFIDRKDLRSFYWSIDLPSNTHTVFDIPDDHKKMIKVLNWLESLDGIDSGLADVVERTKHGNKGILRDKLKKSVEDYQSLENFSSLNLVKYFENGTIRETANAISEMVDYNGLSLPQWFIDRRVTCDLTAFLQNASVLHRVMFSCQVELLHEPSAYKCAIGIRQVMYGILKKTSTRDKGGKRCKNRKKSILEFDRCGKDEEQNFVEPIGELAGFGPLPNIRDLEQESESKRRELLFHALGMPSTVVDSMDMNETSLFLVAIAAYWIRHACPIVTENDLNSLLMCVLLLHLKCLERMDDTASSSGHTETVGLHADIVAAYRSSSITQLSNVNAKMNSITSNNLEHPHGVEVKIVHGFAQFQTCFKAAIHLNQLLLSPIPPINPSLIFSGTIVYNLRRVLHPEVFIKEMLGQDSPLNELFIKLRKQVFEVLEGDQSGETSKSKTDENNSKHARVKGSSHVKSATSNSDLDDVGKAYQSMTLDPRNRFSLLSGNE